MRIINVIFPIAVVAVLGCVEARADQLDRDVAELISPSVVTNFNKYGEDVLTITGAVTNGYSSVGAALEAARPGDTVSLVANVCETITFDREGTFAVDLNGFTLSPSAGETDVVRFAGVSGSSIVSVVNGTLSGDLRFGLTDVLPVSAGFVVLGDGLVSDGDIYATGDVHVLLADGFRSTYSNGVYSTDIQLEAQEGAVFAYRHNPRDARKSGKLVFPSPELQLVSEKGEFVVKEPPLLQKWSFDLSHWMEDIPDETPISKICLPASHDSGMVKGQMESFGEGAGALISWVFAKRAYATQKYSIGEQLKSGCRMFDLRFRVGEDEAIRAYHAMDNDTNFGYVGESISDILKELTQFIKQNPSEFVLIELSHWAKSKEANEVQTYEKVINAIKDSELANGLLYCANATGEQPNLNLTQLRDVRGKVIILIATKDGKYPADPVNGFWTLGDCKAASGPGMFNIYDDYSNSDDFDEMSADQYEKWKNHAGDPLNVAFSLDWTLTAQKPDSFGRIMEMIGIFCAMGVAAAIVAGIVSIFTFGFVTWLLAAVISFGAIVSTYKAYEADKMYIDNMAEKANCNLSTALAKIPNEGYQKPSFVSLDFVDEKLCRMIVELNLDLCKYAAEVCRVDGSGSKKYEKLNDAFNDERLAEGDNGYVVRLLRSEEPDDANGFVVEEGRYVKFDLNGKWLRNGRSLNQILTNTGEIEIVNSKSESGGVMGGGIVTRGLLVEKGKMILNGIATEGGSSALINQTGGELYLTNCLINVSSGAAYYGTGGRAEMFGGKLTQTNVSPLAFRGAYLSGGEFILRRGEISFNSAYPMAVQSGARFEVREGFVRSSTAAAFEIYGEGEVKLYGGCYSGEVPAKYIVNGVCDKVATYPAYPYEIVPCRGEERAVAEIREIANSLYGSVQDAVDDVARRGGGLTIDLLANTHPTESIEIPAGTAVTLDLQGYGITLRGTEKSVVRNCGGLTITDSSANAAGFIEAFATNGCHAAKKGGVVYNEGDFTLSGGTLRTGYAELGGGIYSETNAIARIEGGEISGCRATESGGVYNLGLMELCGGRIESCSAQTGGGIRNEGDLHMTNGEIRSCSAEIGGGLYNGHNAVLIGGVIADNTATEGEGAGVYAEPYTETVLCGVSVKDSIDASSRRSSTVRLRVVEGLFGDVPDAAWIAEGSIITPNEDSLSKDEYPCRVVAQYVAEVGRKKYATLQDAFRQTISTGREVEVKLLTDVRNVAEELPDGTWAALDLAGYWLFGAQDALVVHKSARLRVYDSVGGGTVSCLCATNGATANAILSRGFCAIEGGRYADHVTAADNRAIVRSGLFGYAPRATLVDPTSESVNNPDEASRQLFPYAVMASKSAQYKGETTEALALQEALGGGEVQGESVRTVEVTADQFGVALVVPAGTKATLDLCGHVLQGVAHRPIITVEAGAELVIVDSVGGGRLIKDDVAFYDSELQGAIVNRGRLTLAGGTIANCVGTTFGGVYNAEGAIFVMSGGTISGCGSTESKETSKSVGGVLNRGTFLMTGGEIVDCEAVFGVVGVFNEEGALFRQLGGKILNRSAVAVTSTGRLSLVENRGVYVIVDGMLANETVGMTGGTLIYNSYPKDNYDTHFTLLWGELLTDSKADAIYNANGLWAGYYGGDVTSSRISNGKIRGRVVSSTINDFGIITGGFFADVQSNVVSRVATSELCEWQTNDDAATKDFYDSRVTPLYEAEVSSGGGLYGRLSLQEALNVKYSGSYTVKLVTDVKDCVVCSNTVPVTLDLNGYAITGTGKVFADGFARPVIRNEGNLTIIDSSEKKTGLIALPSVGTAEKGGVIDNRGTLEVRDVELLGGRAKVGGGIYNAENAEAKLTNVKLTGCRAASAEAGDLVFNEGTIAFTDSTLDAWPDATDPSRVREGSALYNAGEKTLENCAVHGLILDATDCVVKLSEDKGDTWFATLAEAVAAAKYGSTIIVVGDVTGESVKIPSGMTVRIGSNGQFRPPKAEDLLHDYYKVITNFDGDVVVSYEYMLDADKVAPRVGDDSETGTPWLEFVVDEKTGLVTSAIINIVNAYEDLYYGVDSGLSPTNLTRATKWVPVFERGSLRLPVPAAENGYFYRVRATDHVGGTMPDGSGYRLMAE